MTGVRAINFIVVIIAVLIIGIGCKLFDADFKDGLTIYFMVAVLIEIMTIADHTKR